MSQPQAQETPTEAFIKSKTMPGKGWSVAAREDALNRLIATGLPTRRDEYWKYTRPDTLTQATPEPAAIFTNDEAPLFENLDRLKIVFIDGVFDADASDDLTLEGISIERLEQATSDLHWARDLYGTLEKNGQDPVERPLAALNTAFATDGVLIHVTGQPSKPVSLIYRHKSETSDAILHHVVKLDAGASLTLLETAPPPHALIK